MYSLGVQMIEIYNEQVRDLLLDNGGQKRYPFIFIFDKYRFKIGLLIIYAVCYLCIRIISICMADILGNKIDKGVGKINIIWHCSIGAYNRVKVGSLGVQFFYLFDNDDHQY